MLKKLLIANRGEIVARIIRTCRELGIPTVAICSDADQGAAYLKLADETVTVGPANPLQSYLNIDAIIDAARKTGADSIHPGYGFLSENAAFAEAVVQAGLVWVGPAPETLGVIHSKCYCRHVANDVNVPVIPGTLDPVHDAADVIRYGREHGYPLFLKLDKGGGGKGIEIVQSEEDAAEVFKRASSIGQMAFGDSACYIEEVVSKPRHIEIQFLADTFGNIACLGERECSIQRRHQKIIEESPSTVVTPAEREMLFEYSRRLVTKLNYHGSGTFEGLRSEDGNYYFMEVNARLQVEHPVTEMLTGIDIVRCQLEIAAGEKLGFEQEDIKTKGHSIEARVYAEDPETFFPSPGTITEVVLPPTGEHLRIDHALEPNGTVPPFYDPLLAKVISWGETRQEATDRLMDALGRFRIEGVKTTISANVQILGHPRYAKGDVSTHFMSELSPEPAGPAA
ncbi:MAG: biotin carboxylase N-terminal domain-containing protein [Deltaproteobacteria bacterium]